MEMLGIPVSVVINTLYKQIIMTRSIPFSLGSQYMRGYVLDCVLPAIHFCFSGYFCAYGLSGISFLHNSISVACARIPLGYLASKYFVDTLFPMGLATTAGSGVSVVICIGVFIWMQRKQN